MPRIAYETKNFRTESLEIIARANAIASQYAGDGYSLTLRQLYYRFVAGGHLANNDRNYKRLGGIVNDARLAGLMDWYHITDRTRFLRTDPSWDSPESIINSAAAQFQRDLWTETDQQYRPEVWVEKDALIDVVAQACDTYRVPHFSCRGYVSQSEMWTAGRRMQEHIRRGRTPIVIHLGDHDPSGIDMTRDITERLNTFAETWGGNRIEVKRIALTMEQIEEYQPPPNPAKITDSRAEKYIDEYGYESWELDALEPQMLDALIREQVAPYIDADAWSEGTDREREDRDQMQQVAQRWDEISAAWDRIEDMLED